jgi:heme-degrading monooxygenase HmoA
MYMRLLHAKSKSDSILIIRHIYDREIIPRLQKMPGCLFSCLIQNDARPDEGISMTFWDTQAHADDYEQSGQFQELLNQVKPHLSEASEWKIQLSKNLKVEYQTIAEEPVLKAYTSAAYPGRMPPGGELSSMYLRILELKISDGMMDEFFRICNEEVMPALRSVQGCRYATLSESAQERNQMLSLTIWDSREDALNYENSALHIRLNEKVKHTFSDLFQWKMVLEEETGKKVMTSEDPNSAHYSIVTGQSFTA